MMTTTTSCFSALVFVALLVCSASALCSNMQQYNKHNSEENDWMCIPCGGMYSCKTQGSAQDECWTTSVPGCNLPFGASQWACCRDCDVKSNNMCPYNTPNDGGDGGDGGGSCGSGCITGITIGALFLAGIACVVVLFAGLAMKKKRERAQYANLSNNPMPQGFPVQPQGYPGQPQGFPGAQGFQGQPQGFQNAPSLTH